jgi:hypothetical protein
MFKYLDAKHRTLIKAPSFRRLLNAVRKYIDANNLEIQTEQQVIDNVCGQMPDICFDSDTPPLYRKAINLVGETARWIKAGVPVTPKETLDSRLATCEGCKHWGGTRGSSLMSGRCGKCGCSGIKLAMATTKCPIGKW